jgi:hypothetical protein
MRGAKASRDEHLGRDEATATNSVFKPQGGLADERDKKVVTAS